MSRSDHFFLWLVLDLKRFLDLHGLGGVGKWENQTWKRMAPTIGTRFFFLCVCVLESIIKRFDSIDLWVLCEGNICWFSHGDLKIEEGSSQEKTSAFVEEMQCQKDGGWSLIRKHHILAFFMETLDMAVLKMTQIPHHGKFWWLLDEYDEWHPRPPPPPKKKKNK